MDAQQQLESAWGRADLLSIAVAAAFCLTGWLLNLHRPAKPKFRDLVANGLALGPLLMIVADPVNKFFGVDKKLGLPPTDLLRLVLTEARVTLWWAAIVAITDIIDALRPEPATTQMVVTAAPVVPPAVPP